MDTVETLKAMEEQKALMTEFFESYRVAFPDSTPGDIFGNVYMKKGMGDFRENQPPEPEQQQ